MGIHSCHSRRFAVSYQIEIIFYSVVLTVVDSRYRTMKRTIRMNPEANPHKANANQATPMATFNEAPPNGENFTEETLATRRESFPAQGTPSRSGDFDIVAINAGEGNGWHFSEDVLRDALMLFDGAQCFVDHIRAGHGATHSVRDLAGVLSEPRWDEREKGVRCRLTPIGPAAELLKNVGRDVLKNGAVDPRVGFSADLAFTAAGKNVTALQRVYSVDLVINPARGGAFKDMLALIENAPPPKCPTCGAQKIPVLNLKWMDERPVRTAFADQPEPAPVPTPSPAEQSPEVVALRAELLSQSIAAAALPPLAAEKVRTKFADLDFTPAQLREEIERTRDQITALTGRTHVRGIPAGSLRMADETDQVTAALHELLGVASDSPTGSPFQTAKLSGIREFYTLMTGDTEFRGGYYPERAQFATSADLPNVLKNVLNKLVVQRWKELGQNGYRWWEPLVTVEHFNNLQQITGVLVGEISLMPSINEGAAYAPLNVKESAETGNWTKYGGYLGLTIEMFERDDTFRLKQFPQKLATAGLRRISSLVGAVFTDNAGTGPVMADGKNLFDATRLNLGTAALTPASWEAASAAIYDQPLLNPGGGAGPKQAIDARYLVVPRSLRLTASQIRYGSLSYEPHIHAENLQQGSAGDVITCPEFTDPNDWAAVADPKLVPAIFIGERFGLLPEIYIADGQLTGALFTHDEVRIKARHFLSVFAADYRPLYKANVPNE